MVVKVPWRLTCGCMRVVHLVTFDFAAQRAYCPACFFLLQDCACVHLVAVAIRLVLLRLVRYAVTTALALPLVAVVVLTPSLPASRAAGARAAVTAALAYH
jgi:hypothetical protein